MSEASNTPSVLVFDFIANEVRWVTQEEANEGVRANCRDHGHIFATAGREPIATDLCICGEVTFEQEYPSGL